MQRTADALADLSFDVLQFIRCYSFLTNKYFCYGWIRVAFGIILGIERLQLQYSYNRDNCYNITVSISMHRPLQHTHTHAHAHTQYLDCSSLEAAPITYDASILIIFLSVRSAFSLFSIRPTCDVQTWSFKYENSIGEGEIRLCLCPIQVTCYMC